MVTKVGVVGGHSIFGIGTQEEMQIFFKAIEKYSRINDPYTDYNIILDRLYKRYLRFEDLSTAKKLLNKIEDIFSNSMIPHEYIDFAIRNEQITSFQVRSTNLGEFFAAYLEFIQKAIDVAILCYKFSEADGENLYEKVMICHTDTVPYVTASLRPDELYDNLEGEPYWMREPFIDWDTTKK